MNPIVAAAAIGVGGTVIVGVAGFWASVRNTSKTTALTLRAVELSEQGQVADRYTRAIEQLGSEKLDVRLGAIYALERVAHDSHRDHPTIMEVLAAFIREHSREQWPPTADEAPGRGARPDIQAAVTVIGRRNPTHDRAHVDLFAANLAGTDLDRADLTGANLRRADLTGATLIDTVLTGALLVDTVLTEAVLVGADLTGAFLWPAYLTGAALIGTNFTGANLRSADLTGATLTRAKLMEANLTSADLTGADLTDADLTGADLTDARLSQEAPVPGGWVRDTGSGRLKRADTNSGSAATD
jgi:uncharacterized protein YjbI with pentapeptide repeats